MFLTSQPEPLELLLMNAAADMYLAPESQQGHGHSVAILHVCVGVSVCVCQ